MSCKQVKLDDADRKFAQGEYFVAADMYRQIYRKTPSKKRELRGDVAEIVESLQERVENVVKGTATTFDVNYDMELTGAAASFNTIHPEFVDFMGEELSNANYKILLRPKLGGSEDVSYMMKRVEDNGGRAIHYLLGTSLKAPHHNDAFDYDEDVLGFGVQAFIDTIKIFSEI